MRQIFRNIELQLQDDRSKLTTNKHQLATLMQKVGDLANDLLEYDNNSIDAGIYEDAIQVAAMAIRIALQGDADFKYIRKEKKFKVFQQNLINLDKVVLMGEFKYLNVAEEVKNYFNENNKHEWANQYFYFIKEE